MNKSSFAPENWLGGGEKCVNCFYYYYSVIWLIFPHCSDNVVVAVLFTLHVAVQLKKKINKIEKTYTNLRRQRSKVTCANYLNFFYCRLLAIIPAYAFYRVSTSPTDLGQGFIHCHNFRRIPML